MSRSHGFDLNLIYDGESVRVTGSVSEYVPARTNCSNDDACPAEGGEIEDFRIYAEDGTEMEDADGKIQEALTDSIMEAVSEEASSDKADAAEARRDRDEDR